MSGFVLAASAALCVLGFGAVDQPWFAPAQLAVILLAGKTFWQEGLPQLTRPAKLLSAALLLIPVLQLLPLPESFLASLSAFRPGLSEAVSGAAVPGASVQSISIYPYATVSALLRLMVYLLVFTLAARNYQVHRRQPRLIGLLIGLGVFEASYGIVQYVTGFPYIFFYKKMLPGPEATGTYISHNHFAGLLAMILPFLAARMFSHLDPRSSGNEGFRKLILAKESSFFFRDTLIFALVLLGLIFSLSRAGIAAGVVGLGVAGVLTLTRSRGYGLILLLAILLVAGAYASWIGLLPLFARVGELDLVMSDTTMRMDIWRDTVRLILDSPLLGTGLGTYNWASLQYQSSLLQYRYEHAHNDILQTAAELGVPLAVGLWAGLMALLIRLIRKAPHFSRTSDRVLAAGCSGAMAAILLHSLFDFNLQIPANALIFAWITGTAAALAQSRRTRSMQESPQLAHPFAAGPIVVDTQALDDPS